MYSYSQEQPVAQLPAAPPASNANGYAEIVARLRDWIVDEALPPGTPLPKQKDLARRFQVSNLTLGRAMRELQDDGFVVAIRRAGSFVAEGAPHLHRFGLVLPSHASTSFENRFCLALTREAARVSETTDRTIVCYHGLDGHTDRADYRRLTEDLARRRLAGIVFASPPFLLRGHPVLEQPGLPRAAIMPDDDAYPQVAKVSFRAGDLAHRALARLADEGRRRLAALVKADVLTEWEHCLAELAPAHGLEHRPEWLQGCELNSPDCGRRIVRLLLAMPPEQRPDALLIADDNLVQQATQGIVESGIAAPAELAVIAHCNFPWPVPAAVPVQRLGFDAGEILAHCLQALDSQLCGDGVPPPHSVPALFEEEYAARRQIPLALAASNPAPTPMPGGFS